MLTVTFTGDVHFGAAYDDPQVIDEEIRRVCCRSDYVVVNVEGPITSSPPQPLPGFVLHSDPRSTAILDTLGNLVFDLANNHVLDHGLPGLRDTVGLARSRGWLWLGAGENLEDASRPCILTDGNLEVGLVGVCGKGVPYAGRSSAGVFGDAPERLVRQKIRELRRHVRWLVVVYHGGDEYTRVPRSTRRNRLIRYLKYGADIVVAHHAHCVQAYEQVGDGYLFFGLGNLVFDLDRHRQFEGTDESVLLSFSFSDQSFQFVPVFSRNDRDQRRIFRIGANPHFFRASADWYAREWGLEASQRLQSLWDARHEGLSRNGWRDSMIFYWKKLCRVGGLILLARNEHLRPYIIGGIMHHLRNAYSPRRRRP